MLGELLAGIVIGCIAQPGTRLEAIKTDASIDMLSRIGVLILLFEVGLESTIGQMLSVGLSAFLGKPYRGTELAEALRALEPA